MSWKTVVVRSNQKINIKNNQCQFSEFDNPEKTFLVDFNDINCILLENSYSLISCKLLTKISEYNILLINCNSSFDPTGIFLPFNSHWKPLEIFNHQINISQTLKQMIWTKIVEQKIINTLNVMHLTNCSEKSIIMVERFLGSLTINDKTNREALTAKVFFREMYGSSFIRFNDDAINGALNYGYKIIAANISRTIVKYGLHTHLGVFHIGKTNNWNLSYDFIEPFRPLVDMWIYYNHPTWLENKISCNDRLGLVNLLNQEVVIDKKLYTVTGAIEIMIKSYVTVLKENDFAKLKLPTIVSFYDKDNKINEQDESY